MPPRFYATLPADQASRQEIPAGQPIMLTAASFQTVSAARGRPGELPMPSVPYQVTEIAVDPGGFVAAIHGGYKFTWESYENWLQQFGPRLTWAAFPDLPCEASLASDAYVTRQRQRQTLEWAWELWGDECGFLERTQQPWAWVPTIQGRHIDEYIWMAQEMAELFADQEIEYDMPLSDEELALVLSDGEVKETDKEVAAVEASRVRTWAMRCATHWRVGIGSLCRRNKRDEIKEMVRIVQALHEILPGVRFHLWGVKLSSLRELIRAGLIDCIASFDTAAFNGAFGKGLEKRKYEMKTMHVSQRTHGLAVALPRYQNKVAGALAQRNLL